MAEPKQNFAFISYNHKDVKWAKWLRRRLEWYRLPSEIHNEFEDSRYIRPVFRDRDELNTGILNNELRDFLERSKFLIVICSPNSAQSAWVSDEVKAFIEMGRLEQIIPFIVDGSPQDYSRTDISSPLMGECFPLALRKWNMEHPDANLLGIAVTDDGKRDRQKAFIRIVSRMLDVGFDVLWKRRQRELRALIAIGSFIILLLAALTYWFAIPVQLSIRIDDEQSKLPPMESGILYVNKSEHSITGPDTTIDVITLPGYYRMRPVEVAFVADRYYDTLKQSVMITGGVSQSISVQLHRDKTFSTYSGTVTDEFGKAISEAVVHIEGQETTTDAQGHFSLSFPLKEQTETKQIIITHPSYGTYERKDESPGDNKYILYR